MELRHLRYFIAVVEEGSFTAAAAQRLHTAQPSLSRQIRDLETELAAELIVRSAQGLTLTPAGRVFLEHARFILARVESAREATQRAALSRRARFVIGFLTGYEGALFSEVLAILRDQLTDVDLIPNSASSPHLTQALVSGKVDLAFLRPYERPPELEFRLLARESLVAVVPRTHKLAARATVGLQDLENDTLIGISSAVAPSLRKAIDEYVLRSGMSFKAGIEADYLHMAFTLVQSTPGICILANSVRNLLPPSLIAIPLEGQEPVVDLAIAYNRHNPSPVLHYFLSNADSLIAKHLFI